MEFLSNNGMNFSQAFKYGIHFKRIDDNKDEPVINFNPLSDFEINAKTFFSPTDQNIVS